MSKILNFSLKNFLQERKEKKEEATINITKIHVEKCPSPQSLLHRACEVV